MRDRLTSRGWAWRQGLVRFLDVEEAMFQCTGGCTSCDVHSGELESATRYAARTVQQPVPHMDAVLGEKVNTMTNAELGRELDRWADNRDRIPNLDSIALRVTASRLRAIEEGCDHPEHRRWRSETAEFCQECGAIVGADGETVNKWTSEEPQTKYEKLLRQYGVSTPDKRSYEAEEAEWHEKIQQDARRINTTWTVTVPEESVRGGSRADGPLLATPSTGRLPSEQVADLGKQYVPLGTLATDLEDVANTLEESSKAAAPVKRDPALGLRCGKVFAHNPHPWGTRNRLECNGRGELNQPPNTYRRGD